MSEAAIEPAHTIKKKPEHVRSMLLEAASKIASNDGLNALTLQAVASAAHVTKGGLFHYFESKQSLIEAMINEQIAHFEITIQSHIKADNVFSGRFTRAYVSSILDWEIFAQGSLWGAMASQATSNQTVRKIWSDWINSQLAQHCKSDKGMYLESIRYSADGAWLSYLIDRNLSAERVLKFRNYLIEMTFDAEQ